MKKTYKTDELKIYVKRNNFKDFTPKSWTVDILNGETFNDILTGDVYSLRQNPIDLKNNNEYGAYLYSLRLLQKQTTFANLLPEYDFDENDWQTIRALTKLCKKETLSINEIEYFVYTVNKEINILFRKIEQQKLLEQQNSENE